MEPSANIRYDSFPRPSVFTERETGDGRVRCSLQLALYIGLPIAHWHTARPASL